MSSFRCKDTKKERNGEKKSEHFWIKLPAIDALFAAEVKTAAFHKPKDVTLRLTARS